MATQTYNSAEEASPCGPAADPVFLPAPGEVPRASLPAVLPPPGLGCSDYAPSPTTPEKRKALDTEVRRETLAMMKYMREHELWQALAALQEETGLHLDEEACSDAESTVVPEFMAYEPGQLLLKTAQLSGTRPTLALPINIARMSDSIEESPSSSQQEARSECSTADTVIGEATPKDLGLPGTPSNGSELHHLGVCKPCAFVFKGGCTNGTSCNFCHLCELGEKKRRKKEFKERKRARAAGILEW